MIVVGDQPDRTVAPPLDPARHLVGVGAGVERIACRASMQQAKSARIDFDAGRDSSSGRAVLGTPEISIRWARPRLHQREAALEPAGAAGQHDDRVGPLVAGRARQQHREGGIAERVEQQQQGDDPEEPADHSIRPKARRMVRRATSMARRTPSDRQSDQHAPGRRRDRWPSRAAPSRAPRPARRARSGRARRG